MSEPIILRKGACSEFATSLGQNCKTPALPPDTDFIPAAADRIDDILIQPCQRDAFDLCVPEPIKTSAHGREPGPALSVDVDGAVAVQWQTIGARVGRE